MGALAGIECKCQENFGDLLHTLHPHQDLANFPNPQSRFCRRRWLLGLPTPAKNQPRISSIKHQRSHPAGSLLSNHNFSCVHADPLDRDHSIEKHCIFCADLGFLQIQILPKQKN